MVMTSYRLVITKLRGVKTTHISVYTTTYHCVIIRIGLQGMEEMREAAAHGVKRRLAEGTRSDRWPRVEIDVEVHRQVHRHGGVHMAGINVGRQCHGHRQRAHGGVPPILMFIVFTTLHLAIVDTLPLCQRCGS